jgi:hypothetical protein
MGDKGSSERSEPMTYHLQMVQTLTACLEQGVGNAEAISARIQFHRRQLAKHGVFAI